MVVLLGCRSCWAGTHRQPAVQAVGVLQGPACSWIEQSRLRPAGHDAAKLCSGGVSQAWHALPCTYLPGCTTAAGLGPWMMQAHLCQRW